MHGYILFNKGQRVTNYISWRDERAANEQPHFSIDKSYGVDVKPNLPRLSLQKQTIEYDEFMTLGSFISYSLTGKNASHITDITPTGLFNRAKNKYDRFGFKTPKVYLEAKAVGKYEKCSIYSPVGDQQCSVKGILDKYSTEDCYVLNIGTASQLCCVCDGFPTGEFESRPFFEGKTLCTITRLPGGALIKQFTDVNALVDTLYNEYLNALAKLPNKSKIIVTGGGSKKYREAIETVLKKISIEYIYSDDIDALFGLNYIAKGEIFMSKVGMMLSEISHQSIPIIMKNSGFDFFILDYEHGPFDYESMAKIIATSKLCGLKCIVRLPNNERKDIIKTLDMGADGLLLPMTNNRKDIEKVINFAKYPPLGKRGISTMRAHTLYNPGNIMEYIDEVNVRLEIYAQIETSEGVNNIGEIINTNGVTGVMVGPNDLSADYSCLGDNNSKKILAAIETVSKETQVARKSAYIITGNKNYLDKAKECGFDGFCVGSELNAIKEYCKKVVAENK